MVKFRKTRVRIEVFVPTDSCICNYANFMEKIGRITSKFRDATDVQIKSNKSSEAFEYGIQDMGIVINGKTKLPLDFEEQELQDAIIQEASQQ